MIIMLGLLLWVISLPRILGLFFTCNWFHIYLWWKKFEHQNPEQCPLKAPLHAWSKLRRNVSFYKYRADWGSDHHQQAFQHSTSSIRKKRSFLNLWLHLFRSDTETKWLSPVTANRQTASGSQLKHVFFSFWWLSHWQHHALRSERQATDELQQSIFSGMDLIIRIDDVTKTKAWAQSVSHGFLL